MQDAWSRSVLPAVKERSIPIATLLSEATPSGLDGDTLTLTFRPGADFHRKQVDEPANSRLLRDALYDVTGRKLAVLTAVADAPEDDDAPGGDAARRAGGHLAARQRPGRNRDRGDTMKLDMNALMKQAQQMQEQMAQAQEAAKDEIAEASAGGGMVTARANGAGELVEIRIDPRAIDPDDPEMLADMVLAASNEALRAAAQAVEAKLRSQLPDLGGLGLPGL